MIPKPNNNLLNFSFHLIQSRKKRVKLGSMLCQRRFFFFHVPRGQTINKEDEVLKRLSEVFGRNRSSFWLSGD